MPRPLQLSKTAPFAVKDGARRIGERLTLARKRRRLTLREVAAKAGISYDTARAVKAGNLQIDLAPIWLCSGPWDWRPAGCAGTDA